MELTYFFESSPVWLLKDRKQRVGNLRDHIDFGVPVNGIESYKLAIIGVTDERNSDNKGCGQGPDKIREELYNLAWNFNELKIVDLGNLIQGNTIDDSYSALKMVCELLMEANVTVIVLGADQDLTYGLFNAYNTDKQINLLCVDSAFDLTPVISDFNASCWLNGLLHPKIQNLRNVSFLAYQTYFVGEELLRLTREKFFDELRLGILRNKMDVAEPYFRDSDLVSFDISSIRSADAPAHVNAGPNGLYGEEACALARYAGISDRLTIFGLFGMNPSLDFRNISAELSAQIIWYFIEGFYFRRKDYPAGSLENYTRFYVEIDDIDFPLVFYKSSGSDRWWMELTWDGEPVRTTVVSCTEDDYKTACKSEVPESWWRNYRKGK
ncbi:MAG: formimidoylglutamase [Bacteroidota bacterium]|nr:formimidoylglutamase [Bacteroidota bacterium]